MIVLLILLSLALLCSVAVNVVFVTFVKRFPRTQERERNLWAARESELLDRIMHQAGQTWTAPPRPEKDEVVMSAEELQRIQEGWEEV